MEYIQGICVCSYTYIPTFKMMHTCMPAMDLSHVVTITYDNQPSGTAERFHNCIPDKVQELTLLITWKVIISSRCCYSQYYQTKINQMHLYYC